MRNPIDLCLVPAAVQSAETTAATKLIYVLWDTAPFSVDTGARLTFGTDDNAYVLSLGDNGSGKFYWRITRYEPPTLGTFGANDPGTMTDLTASLWGHRRSEQRRGRTTATPATPTFGFRCCSPSVRLPATKPDGRRAQDGQGGVQ